MKKTITYILLLFAVLLSSMTTQAPFLDNINPKKETEILQTILSIIKTRHIVTRKFDDDFSKKMFKTYIDSLDRNKLFLLQSDIEEFKKYETQLDEHLKTNDLTFFFMTFDRIKLRMAEGKEIYTTLLKNKLDYSKNIESEYASSMQKADFDKLKFGKNKKDLERKWGNFLKTYFLEKIKHKAVEKKNLKFTPEEIAYLLNAEAETLKSPTTGALYDFDNISRESIFQCFINAILYQFDNYSKYYNPVNRNDYLTKLSGKVEGVGISMQLIDNNVQIINITEGGPAWKSKKFVIGDIILKVTQNKESPVNVVGFSPLDVTKLLKGDVGTFVKITIKKQTGKIEDIALKRGLVAMNDTYLKSCIIKKNKVTYGLINIPRFYNDLEDEKAKNTVDDFINELEILKREGAKAIILDLRNNKGGDLEAAAKIIGSFLNKGPIAQFKSREQNMSTLDNNNLKRNFAKNVVVIVNNYTASEAELIVAAFKEYNIGVVVGTSTKGNGTTQEYINLNEFRTDKLESTDMGAMVFSSRMFYKLNGTTVQKKGIVPDVSFFATNKKQKEYDVESEIEIQDTKPVEFVPTNKNDLFDKAIKNSIKRNSESTILKKYLNNNAAIYAYNANAIKIKTLNSKKFAEQLQLLFKTYPEAQTLDSDKTIEFNLTPEAKKQIIDKQYLAVKRNKWLENISNDYQVHESLNILEEVLFAK